MLRSKAIAKYFVLTVAFIAANLISFYSGAEWGMRQWLHLNSPVLAMYNVRTLEALRAGRSSSAINLQEQQLSFRILEHMDTYPGWTQFLWTRDMRLLASKLPKAGSLVTEYRQKYPFVATTDIPPEIATDIKSGISRFRELAESSPRSSE